MVVVLYSSRAAVLYSASFFSTRAKNKFMNNSRRLFTGFVHGVYIVSWLGTRGLENNTTYLSFARSVVLRKSTQQVVGAGLGGLYVWR